MNAYELKMHRLNTDAFIKHRPSTIVLQRAVEVRTPSGGKAKGAPSPRSAQTMRLIQLNGVASNVVTLSDGTQRVAEYQLLASHDADVEVDDTWIDSRGRTMRVGDIQEPNGYELRAFVVQKGA